MQDLQTNILMMLTDMNSSVCIFGAILMFIRGKNNRARRMLGYTLMLWGICSVARSLVIQEGLLHLLLHPMRPVGLIGGNLFTLLMVLFPLEIMFPGWLNLKRVLLIMLPSIILTGIYLVVLQVLGREAQEFSSFSEFIGSIEHFNVWFRVLFLLLVIIYNVLLVTLVYRNEKKYVRWKNDNYADVDYMDISWMRFYAFISMAIFASWMLNVFMACKWNFILNTVISLVGFSYIIYKGLFYESAYPEDYFKYVNGSPLGSSDCSNNIEESIEKEPAPCNDDTSETVSFEEKIPCYVETFKSWMEKEKPYLYKDFKLTDVARVLPLNRSYLSRVLNEGFGMNFCQVVRGYRIEASKELLRNCPDMPIYEIAEKCGFSSDTIFIRAFQKEMNITPSRYRAEQQLR